MKKVKKLVSLLLAAMMVMAMSVTAFAEEDETATTYTITINNETQGHKYEAYQIFAGDLHTDDEGNKVLSNIVWGKGVNPETLKTELGNDFGCTTADGDLDPVKVAEKLGESGADAKAFAAAAAKSLATGSNAKTEIVYNEQSKKYTATVEVGYYLIKEADSDSVTGAHDAYTDFILQVVGDVEVAPKSAWPTVDKQVQDEVTDAETGTTDGWGETADHAIYEPFDFKLTATIPSDNDYIENYTSYKLIFNDTMSKGVTFKEIKSVSVKVGETTKDLTAYATHTTESDGTNETTNLKVTIDNLLDETNGVSSIKGATVTVIYTAFLNENAQVSSVGNATTTNKNNVYLEYSNNPNSEAMGKTTDDNVWVFTYEMKNKKVDGDQEPLKDAGFKLYDSTGTEIGLIYDNTLSAYRPVKTTGETAEEMKSAVDGTFNIVGLDAGTYTLKETTTPSGYNTCEEVTIVISADPNHAEDANGQGATATIKMTQNGEDSTMNTIVNKKGSTLPSTGGIGTTIFYLCGGILVVFAAVALITKKRMKSER